VLDTALNNCTTYQNAAMAYINANASPNVELKVVSNLYYPGYDADNTLSNCTVGGVHVNLRDTFLPYLAKMNWRTCNAADSHGFACVDNFAEYMGADYDSNGDGMIDSEALKYVSGESEAAYVTRITVTLKSTIRDANTHFASASTSYDYIQSDDTHPTYTGPTIWSGLFGGSSSSGAPRYTSFPGGKSPIWNRYGHERMGWSLSTNNPPTP